MFEKIFNVKNIEINPNYALFGGVFFTIISFITSYITFRSAPAFIGVATILFTVIFGLPIVLKFAEVTRAEKDSFFIKTKHLFDFYIYFFIGSFVVFFLLSLAFPSKVLSPEQLFESNEKIIIPQVAGLPPPPIAQSELIRNIFLNNFYVVIISFVLSVLYGTGSLFLLTLNASIFASTLSNVIRQVAGNAEFNLHLYNIMSCNMGILFFHMIPEIVAYLLAAIAGGLLSIVVAREKLFSNNFYKTLKYSLILLVSSIVVLIISALIEVKVSRSLLLSGACLKSTFGVLIVTVILLLAAAIFEFKRKKHLS